MIIEIKVPALSESVAEATLLSWHKKIGDPIHRDENLIDIETDKVVLELPSPDDGVLIEVIKNDGDTVIIKKTNNAESGKIVVALIDNHEATLKRLRKKTNSIALESANPAYETKIFNPERVKIQGILVSLYRNF